MVVRSRAQTYRTRLHHLLQRQVHPRIAGNQMSVQRLAVLELDEHRVPLGGCEEAQWKLERAVSMAFLRASRR